MRKTAWEDVRLLCARDRHSDFSNTSVTRFQSLPELNKWNPQQCSAESCPRRCKQTITDNDMGD